jgi:enolase-phosphatase E1
MQFSGRGILLDIEGTTSSVSFVYDVMFPYVERELESFLIANWHQPELQALLDEMARQGEPGLSGYQNADEWFSAEVSTLVETRSASFEEKREIVTNTVRNEMTSDRKTTWLKRLQGWIWKGGFESGELQAHVYPDVVPALTAWKAAGQDVRIYSSGSVQAQLLFFGHTIAGNLLPHFTGHYDTTIGGKKESDSYRKIAKAYALAPGEILFLSDIVAELDAARAAGLQTALVVREGNATGQSSSGEPHLQVENFAQVELSPRNSHDS